MGQRVMQWPSEVGGTPRHSTAPGTKVHGVKTSEGGECRHLGSKPPRPVFTSRHAVAIRGGRHPPAFHGPEEVFPRGETLRWLDLQSPREQAPWAMVEKQTCRFVTSGVTKVRGDTQGAGSLGHCREQWPSEGDRIPRRSTAPRSGIPGVLLVGFGAGLGSSANVPCRQALGKVKAAAIRGSSAIPRHSAVPWTSVHGIYPILRAGLGNLRWPASTQALGGRGAAAIRGRWNPRHSAVPGWTIPGIKSFLGAGLGNPRLPAGTQALSGMKSAAIRGRWNPRPSAVPGWTIPGMMSLLGAGLGNPRCPAGTQALGGIILAAIRGRGYPRHSAVLGMMAIPRI